MTESERTFNRIQSFIERSDSDELILLKSHLLIEEIFDRILYLKLTKEIADKLNLAFFKKSLLISGLTLCKHDSELMSNILLVNRIRNKFAHNLEEDIREELVKFIKILHGGELPKTINQKKTYINSLKRSFYFLLGNLWSVYQTSIIFEDKKIK